MQLRSTKCEDQNMLAIEFLLFMATLCRILQTVAILKYTGYEVRCMQENNLSA